MATYRLKELARHLGISMAEIDALVEMKASEEKGLADGHGHDGKSHPKAVTAAGHGHDGKLHPPADSVEEQFGELTPEEQELLLEFSRLLLRRRN